MASKFTLIIYFHGNMRPLILCRERLNRLLDVLDRSGRSATVRDLWRSYRIYGWEIEQAAELGWVKIVTHHPPVGRPSRRAEKLSNNEAAKFPPCRHEITKEIRFRHQIFALESVNIMPGGSFGFKQSTLVRAYKKSYPHAKSKKGAYASASRLAKRFDVKVVQFWYRKTMSIGVHEPMPQTISGIAKRLRKLGLL